MLVSLYTSFRIELATSTLECQIVRKAILSAAFSLLNKEKPPPLFGLKTVQLPCKQLVHVQKVFKKWGTDLTTIYSQLFSNCNCNHWWEYWANTGLWLSSIILAKDCVCCSEVRLTRNIWLW